MKLCDAPDCDRDARSPRAPWCDMHRLRMRNNGNLTAAPRWEKGLRCSVDGCGLPARGRGLCGTHYATWRRNGDPTRLLTDDERYGAAVDRFFAKVDKTDECWEWTGSLNEAGYGTFNAGKNHYVYSHRFSYELAKGAIPEGLTIDHLCRNTRCCNPDHLEAVTQAENSRRAVRIQHDHPNAPKTCKRGHDWSVTPPYLAHRANGRVTRRCRICQNEQDRARRSHQFFTEHPALAIQQGVSHHRIGAA